MPHSTDPRVRKKSDVNIKIDPIIKQLQNKSTRLYSFLYICDDMEVFPTLFIAI